jgi:hypothetical protein
MLKGNKTIFNIETSELNPKNIDTNEVEESKEKFESEKYDLKTLREYIQKHSAKLSETGNTIQGESKNENVTLTILKLN